MKEAYHKASRKDEQLLAHMKETNNRRKEAKELLAQEEKKVLKLESIPAQNEKVCLTILKISILKVCLS